MRTFLHALFARKYLKFNFMLIANFFTSASFHPLTNRKHHCRLCGQIICSLPPKLPQRAIPCSLLFIADAKTGRIEEVSEVVDYGVRPRNGAARGKGDAPEEKFLKGVRICRQCKPIMLYVTSMSHVGVF